MDRVASPRKIGLIVNPIAGMGGRVALKGTDGGAILARARALGAEPQAASRAARALGKLAAAVGRFELSTCAGAMGGDAAAAAGLRARVLPREVSPPTTAEDTRAAAEGTVAILEAAARGQHVRRAGEDVPRGQSCRARLLVVEMARRDLSWARLSAFTIWWSLVVTSCR